MEPARPPPVKQSRWAIICKSFILFRIALHSYSPDISSLHHLSYFVVHLFAHKHRSREVFYTACNEVQNRTLKHQSAWIILPTFGTIPSAIAGEFCALCVVCWQLLCCKIRFFLLCRCTKWSLFPHFFRAVPILTRLFITFIVLPG